MTTIGRPRRCEDEPGFQRSAKIGTPDKPKKDGAKGQEWGVRHKNT